MKCLPTLNPVSKRYKNTVTITLSWQSEFFNELKKNLKKSFYFFLMASTYPPPPLNGTAIKKRFFCGFPKGLVLELDVENVDL